MIGYYCGTNPLLVSAASLLVPENTLYIVQSRTPSSSTHSILSAFVAIPTLALYSFLKHHLLAAVTSLNSIAYHYTL